MRALIRLLLLKPITWVINQFASRPDRSRIFESLTALNNKIRHEGGKKGFVIPFDQAQHKFIIFSDQHKGRKNGADDFLVAEPAYLAALDYYNANHFHLIALGDCEELWENTLLQVRKHNEKSFNAEAKFLHRQAFTKIFGNHDLDWEIDPLAPTYLKDIYKAPLIALEAIMLQTTIGNEVLNIFCTHGHQGDLQSDGNWFSKFFVSKIWAPLQSYLQINPNTPAYDNSLKSDHNRIMYEWSANQKNMILITGHTHQPVFESLTYTERLVRKHQVAMAESNAEWAKAIADEIAWRAKTENEIPSDYLKIVPSYFNTGCCCYSDGDITGLEIAEGYIRLIKWKFKNGKGDRTVLEENSLQNIITRLPSQSSTETES